MPEAASFFWQNGMKISRMISPLENCNLAKLQMNIFKSYNRIILIHPPLSVLRKSLQNVKMTAQEFPICSAERL